MATNAEQVIDYLIIGGGLAAATAAEEIRKRDQHGSIVLVTNEPYFPYHRPPLSKEYLRSEIDTEGIYGEGGVYVQLERWYSDQHITVLRQSEATALDTRKMLVQLNNDRTLRYRTLLLAIGGRPRRLNVAGADLPGVHVLRSLDDANAIRSQITEGKRVVIVGSGFIGMEAAASALTRGAKVTIVEPMPRAWSNMVSPAISEYFQRQFASRGAELRYGYGVEGFSADQNGHLSSTHISPAQDGQGNSEDIPCDLAIVGVGIQLNTELAASAGLEVDPKHGIVVNEHLETQVADIFVAGDIAAYPDPLGGRMHFEHWDNAIASAQAAAANMVDGDEPYRHIPYFFSDQFDLSINMLGYPSSQANIVIRGAMQQNAFTALYTQDGILRAALMVNDDAQMDTLTKLIAASARAPQNPETMADKDFDLASLLEKE
jgi:3-phenylpropionate/trans-cinnamate dioxygenase ferredoxin reductase component